jgi:hypothetical protein
MSEDRSVVHGVRKNEFSGNGVPRRRRKAASGVCGEEEMEKRTEAMGNDVSDPESMTMKEEHHLFFLQLPYNEKCR